MLLEKIKTVNVGLVLFGGLLAAPAVAAPAAKPAQFTQCAICHQTSAGARSSIGPNLWGLSSRPAASLEGYAYSPAMKKAGGAWTRDRLIAFITNPRQVVPGTKMAYPGQKDPKVAAAMADYLLSLK